MVLSRMMAPNACRVVWQPGAAGSVSGSDQPGHAAKGKDNPPDIVVMVDHETGNG